MTIRNLEHMFRPRSVALIGASNRPNSAYDQCGSKQMDFFELPNALTVLLPLNPTSKAI